MTPKLFLCQSVSLPLWHNSGQPECIPGHERGQQNAWAHTCPVPKRPFRPFWFQQQQKREAQQQKRALAHSVWRARNDSGWAEDPRQSARPE